MSQRGLPRSEYHYPARERLLNEIIQKAALSGVPKGIEEKIIWL
ncbi:MAG: hypothetical protein AAB456_00300 [Patescibacteria group bacterium]